MDVRSGGGNAVEHALPRVAHPAAPAVGGLAVHPDRSAPRALGLLMLLVLPLVVALGVLHQTAWYPIGDQAQTELRLRDVGSRHTPLIGVFSARIGPVGHEGSHLGPLSFYAMWPVYRLFGGSAWAMQAAAASVQVVAMATILWIAHRRGGLALVLGTTAALAILIRAYGPTVMTEAWVPYLPLLWWLVFLLAVWSVCCGDLPLLPVVVFAGSLCAQAHIPYVGLTSGLGAFAVVIAFVWAYRRRRRPRSVLHFACWLLVAVAVGAAVWVPPTIDQLVNSPGNLSMLWDYFRDPPTATIGLRRGIEVLLIHLNPWRLVAKQLVLTIRLPGHGAERGITTGSPWPGVALLVAWATAVVAAWRIRHRPLLRLHAVLAVALVLAAVSISRIFGVVWFWEIVWAWGITALMSLAVGWTAASFVRHRLRGPLVAHASTAGKLALVGAVALWTALFTFDATRASVPDPGGPGPRLSRLLGAVVTPTVAALDEDPTPGGGRDGRYLISWSDPINLGTQGWGLLNELERRGFHVGTLAVYRSVATPHRVMDPAQATRLLHLAIGLDVDTWSDRPDARRVAYLDPRTPSERVEYRRLRLQVINDLRAAGLADLVPQVDRSLTHLATDPRLPESTYAKTVRMGRLGLPMAVFVAPADGIAVR